MSNWEIDMSEGPDFWLVTGNNIEQCRVVRRNNWGDFGIMLQRGDEHDGTYEAESEAHYTQLFKLSDIEGVRQRMREIIGSARAELVRFEEEQGIDCSSGTRSDCAEKAIGLLPPDELRRIAAYSEVMLVSPWGSSWTRYYSATGETIGVLFKSPGETEVSCPWIKSRGETESIGWLQRIFKKG